MKTNTKNKELAKSYENYIKKKKNKSNHKKTGDSKKIKIKSPKSFKKRKSKDINKAQRNIRTPTKFINMPTQNKQGTNIINMKKEKTRENKSKPLVLKKSELFKVLPKSKSKANLSKKKYQIEDSSSKPVISNTTKPQTKVQTKAQTKPQTKVQSTQPKSQTKVQSKPQTKVQSMQPKSQTKKKSSNSSLSKGKKMISIKTIQTKNIINVESIEKRILELRKRKKTDIKQELEKKGLKVTGKSEKLLKDIYLYSELCNLNIQHEK